MNSTAKRNVPFIVVTVVVWLFLVGAALVSFMHIVHVSQMLGLGWQSWTVPFLVDGIAIVGKVSMLDRFAEPARRSGKRLVMFGGLLSLAANVAAGSNWGQRAFGVLVVAGFMVLENHATKLRPAPVVIEQPTRKLDPEVAAERAAKAKATRERNAAAKLTPAQKAARTRAANRAIDAELAAMTGERVPPNAPVSPALF